ncbi:MAG: 3-deoxy-7-phosphoheptulonate synthase [Lachnospiraceae bacterium]|nr:3-deoxy-7-phosphoheptulonate synthase [Lachnospiraceae bacterium]
MNIELKRKLPAAKKVQEMYPLRAEDKKQKAENDKAIKNIFTGEDDRLILIIGPCSADRDDAVLEYISRLQKVQEQVKEKILIVPRVYTNKPRTTGEGYKGMLHQPDPNARPNLLKGVIAIRKLHIRVLQETGFSCADEMLYPENYRFLSDVLGYVAVGARSVENQQHRLVASGISVPVGMKNPTSGDLSVMMNSIKAAQASHSFIFTDREVESKGNPLTHAILRGAVNRYGKNIPNYHYEDLHAVSDLYKKENYQNPGIVIDCNHSNSGKKYEEQIRIAKEVLHSARHSKAIYGLIKGLMIESYIEDGNQKPDGGVYGKSITDPCLGWPKTERLIKDLADVR